MTPDELWLATVWPFVRESVPPAPARVLEIGCGPLGGFVPMLRAAGYEAIGIDPEAPEGPEYRRTEFEQFDVGAPADAVVACASLHHVADLGETLDKVDAALVPGGRVVIIEWARERFDEATARWCQDRLPEPGDEHCWLQELFREWHESGRSWAECSESWAAEDHMHGGYDVLRELSARFDAEHVGSGPFFFCDLAGTSEADELAAIEAGQIQANRIEYKGRKRQGQA